jgi:hypothetical protein
MYRGSRLALVATTVKVTITVKVATF